MNSSCIFVVDDDPAIVESFKIVLEYEGYRACTAKNKSELTTLFSKETPDLILMDYNLGEDNGGELTTDIKKKSQTAHIPIILISANAQIRNSAHALGADDFMEKPIEIELLLAKVAEHIIHE